MSRFIYCYVECHYAECRNAECRGTYLSGCFFFSLIPGFINKDITVQLDGVRPLTSHN